MFGVTARRHGVSLPNVSVRLALTALLALLLAAPAQGAFKRCPEPARPGDWPRATPQEAAIDAAKLQEAMDYGTSQASYAIRVYRGGCLVGEDRLADDNRNAQYESWSMAKSVTSLVFGRAMTLGLISPDDPVGSLVPEADEAHGKITVRDLLTMTSGLEWNGLRDYNIFTMRDRIRDALTLKPVKAPGTYYEYAQSPVALLAEAVGRAAGEDFVAFAQRELMDPLGITEGRWRWIRDQEGHALAFMGVNMVPDDFGRLGELLRRGGVWKGRRLLSRSYVRNAVAPSPTNGCYGWLIWVNAAAPCIGPTIQERPVSKERRFPDLPADQYTFSGLFGQLVAVFPSQELVVVRTGQDPGLVPAGGQSWEHTLYRKVLAALTDEKVLPPGPPAQVREEPNHDYGFQTALAQPDRYQQGVNPDPLPPAGPARARVPRLWLASKKARRGIVTAVLHCPARWPSVASGAACTGEATLTGARRPVRYRVPAGESRRLRFRVSRRALRRTGPLTLGARNTDAAGGAATATEVTVTSVAR